MSPANGEGMLGLIMKVLIVNHQSQLYLTHLGDWTDDTRQARDFSFTAHARSVARGMQLRSFQIVFFFPDINYRIVVSDTEGDQLATKPG